MFLFNLEDKWFHDRSLTTIVSGSPWRVGIMPGPKMSVVGDSVRLVPAGSPALFKLSALGFTSKEIDVQILSEYKKNWILKTAAIGVERINFRFQWEKNYYKWKLLINLVPFRKIWQITFVEWQRWIQIQIRFFLCRPFKKTHFGSHWWGTRKERRV